MTKFAVAEADKHEAVTEADLWPPPSLTETANRRGHLCDKRAQPAEQRSQCQLSSLNLSRRRGVLRLMSLRLYWKNGNCRSQLLPSFMLS